MNIWRLRELIKDMPDNSPVVMWIQHEDRPEAMAQVSDGTRINGDCEPPTYLLLMASEKDIIRDGKLKRRPTPAPQLPASLSPRLPSPALAQIEGPAVAEVRETTALAVIDSNGKPGGVLKR